MKAVLISISAILLLAGALPDPASARLQPPAKPKSNVELVDFDGAVDGMHPVLVVVSGRAEEYEHGYGERFQQAARPSRDVASAQIAEEVPHRLYDALTHERHIQTQPLAHRVAPTPQLPLHLRQGIHEVA